MPETMIQQIGSYLASQILKQPNRTITADEPLISSVLIDSFSLLDVDL